MNAPTPLEASRVFEFVGGSRLAVILISLHPIHTFSEPLSRRLLADYPDIALGTVDVRDLLAGSSSVLRFVHQGLRACGAPAAWGVLPGYCFFRDGQLLAWDAGLPAFDDVEAIARSAVLAAIWSGLSRDVNFAARALRLATEGAAAERIAARFRYAAADLGARRDAGQRGATTAAPEDELYWAYQILRVLPTATDREVHEAWRRRRVETHPDYAAGDPAEFDRRSRLSADINRARDIIVDFRCGRARARAS